MSIENARNSRSNFVPDPLVQKLVSNPAEIPHLKVATGWLGLSDREEQWRLYLNTRMDEFIEFRVEDVRHCERFDKESPVSRSIVWLIASAALVHTRGTDAEMEGEFLQGGITQGVPISVAGTGTSMVRLGRLGLGAVNTWNCSIRTAGTCTLVLCTRIEECRISREANPCV